MTLCVSLVETQFYSHVVAKFCHKLYHTRAVNTEGAGGQLPLPQFLADPLSNPIPTRGGEIMPKSYYFNPWTFLRACTTFTQNPSLRLPRTGLYIIARFYKGWAGFIEINLHISIYLKLSTSQMGVEG